jgi:hypothetical protein
VIEPSWSDLIGSHVSERSTLGKIFGREPTLIIQSISALLAIGVAVGLPGLTRDTSTLIVAVLVAVLGAVNAAVVRPVAPGAFVGLVAAGAALLAGYGLELSQELVGSVSAAVVVLLALLTRGQVTPNADPKRRISSSANLETRRPLRESVAAKRSAPGEIPCGRALGFLVQARISSVGPDGRQVAARPGPFPQGPGHIFIWSRSPARTVGTAYRTPSERA